MLHQFKTLLDDVQLQQKIKEATNLAEAVKLIVTAGTAKGYNFSKEAVSQTLSTLLPLEANELSEEELLAVGGGGTNIFCCGTDCFQTRPWSILAK